MKLYIVKPLWRTFRFFTAILLIGLPLQSFGQSLDSLEQMLVTKKLTYKEKIRIYDDLNWYYSQIDVARSIDFGKKGLALAKKNGDKKMESTFYKNIGIAHYMGGVHDSARIYLEKAKPIAEELGNYRMQAAIYNAHANIYRVQSLYEQALDNYLNAAKLLEMHNDDQGLTLIYSNIAGVYQIMQNYGQAIDYLKEAEAQALATSDKEGLASVYTSLSDIGLSQGIPKAESVDYAMKSVDLFQETGNRPSEIKALLTLAKVYYHHGDHTSATPIAEQAVRHSKALNFPHLIAEGSIILSNIDLHQGQYERSAAAAMESLETDSTDINIAINAYANLIQANAYLGHPDLTQKYMSHYKTTVDHYANESYQRSLSELEAQYETGKKEIKIDALEKQQKLYIMLSISGAIILLIALSFAYIRYRLAVSKRRFAEAETQRLEQEKQLVAVQATLDGESAERTRLARDLHDGLGSMLSAVKINLPQVKGDAVLEAVDVTRFQKALGMLDDSIQELRRVAHHMMPESLLRYGLKVSLSDFCAAIPIAHFHYFGNEARLQGKLETMVYRCIHELVNNALKHGDATQINVQLVQETERISFTVQDNGKGFDKNTVPMGMGLKNIRQRVDAFDGKMEIYSSDQGTEIHVELELTKHERHD